ncbi:hypothetical protein UQ32_27490 [Escherichia coli]|nr:hypothetical protein UQ32_27490 [Escherichia coli]
MTIKSNTPAHDKDCWQTPLWLFDALDIEFGFWLDSAASDKNAPGSDTHLRAHGTKKKNNI